jgi:hypothetical protein
VSSAIIAPDKHPFQNGVMLTYVSRETELMDVMMNRQNRQATQERER